MTATIDRHISPPASTAQTTITRPQAMGAALIGLLLLSITLSDVWLPIALAVGAGIAIYTSVLVWRVFTTSVSMRNSVIDFDEAELAAVRHRDDLPSITMMVPVRHEHETVVRKQAEAFARLDYPRELLEIFILVDEDDTETHAYAVGFMPAWVTVLPVPTANPRTKPRVLNYGLQRASGEIVGVWDGEDWPEPQQLVKVAAAFSKLPASVMCLQGRLDFRQSTHNLLTKWASIAYHGNFSLFIPALARLNLPVPLGGTSNFFKTDALRAIGAWDAWNVTEDLDLGIRIARHHLHVRIIDTVTEEESNPNLRNCLNQWSRWEKGKMQTWLVHMRDPRQLWRDLGPVGFGTFHLIVGIPIVTLLINPVFMLTTLAFTVNTLLLSRGGVPQALGMTGLTVNHAIQHVFPAPVLYFGAISLFAGNAWFIWLAATGALYRRHYGLVPAAMLCSVHWLLLSYAAYKGLWQLLTHRAHHWELTRHGLMDPLEQLPSRTDGPRPSLADQAA